MCSALHLGILFVYLLGALVGYSFLALVGAVMASVGAVLVVVRLRETPRWLLSRKRKSDALHSLLLLRTNRSDAEDEVISNLQIYKTH